MLGNQNVKCIQCVSYWPVSESLKWWLHDYRRKGTKAGPFLKLLLHGIHDLQSLELYKTQSLKLKLDAIL